MKIALLTDGIFPYVIGGMQKHSFYLAKYLAGKGVHVDLYHCNRSAKDIHALELFSDEEKKNISPFVIPLPKTGKFPGHYLTESFEYSKRCFEALKKNPEVDFIYAKGFSGWKLISEKKKGMKLPPLGVNLHGYEMFQKAAGLRSKAEQYFLRNPATYHSLNADFVFSYGGKITGIIREIGVPENRIIEIPSAIERNWLNPELKKTGTKLNFVFIGRNERRKGVRELSHVLKKLIRNHDFNFHFVGDIPASERIDAAGIFYHGTVNDEKKMMEILSPCDILVCPSYSEGMPNVILEAMARGLSVIASDVGAVNMLINEERGWLIKAGDEETLETAWKAALNTSASLLDEMKLNCREHIAENFLWEDIAEQTIGKIRIAAGI